MKKNQSNRRRGFTIAYALVLMTAMCMVLSLAVDLGRCQLAKTELMRAADSAARAAASKLPGDPASARQTAIQFGGNNTADGIAVSFADADIQLGSWNATARTFTELTGSAASSATAAQVTAHQRVGQANGVPLSLAGILGRNYCDVHSTVIAISTLGPSGYGIVGLDWVKMNGNALVDSYRSSDGPYSFSTARANGNVASNGSITLSGSAGIQGDANPGPGQSVIGGPVSGSTSALIQPLVRDPEIAGNAQFVNNNATVSQFIKNGSFNVTAAETANFQSGVYYFNDFSTNGGATINANIDGPVTIYVAGNFTLTGGSSVYQSKPQNLKVIMLNPGTTASLAGNADIYVDLYAPLSDVVLTGTGDFYGQIVGKTVTMTGNGEFHYDEKLTSTVRKIITVK